MNRLEIIYTALAIAIWVAGYFHNGRFVRPKWKIPGKLVFFVGVSYILAHWQEHWALVFIFGHPLLGLFFHIKICREHGINVFTCEPREKYLGLQEKWASGNFKKEHQDKKEQ